jgi:Protein of unknown function (DUF1579)
MARRATLWFLALAAFLVFAIQVLAQDSTGNAAPSSGEQSAADAAKPGPQQAGLAELAGDYSTTQKFFIHAGVPPAQSHGSAKISVVLDGRFLLERNTVDSGGVVVHGLRLYGYNNVTRQYETVWTYTMSTEMMKMTGTSQDGGKTIEFSGEASTTGAGKVPLTARLQRFGSDKFVITLLTPGPDNQLAPFEETTYVRSREPHPAK